jgi:hypothetical protein
MAQQSFFATTGSAGCKTAQQLPFAGAGAVAVFEAQQSSPENLATLACCCFFFAQQQV